MLRLIDEKGEQLGVMETRKAIAIARERELEVVVVSEKADPPVAKIVDLNKYVYKEQQRKKALAKNARATRTELKEMQFRPKIDNHDFEVKANKIKKAFLEKIKKDQEKKKYGEKFKDTLKFENEFEKALGYLDQVKIVVRFRGRERYIYKEQGMELFERLSKSLETDFLSEPKFVGSSIVAILK